MNLCVCHFLLILSGLERGRVWALMGSSVQVPVQVPNAPVQRVCITGRTRRRTAQSNSRITIDRFSAIETAGHAKGANPPSYYLARYRSGLDVRGFC